MNQETVLSLVRPNVQRMQAYSSARDEFSGTASVYLDANENPYGAAARYPDPYQREAKALVAKWRGIDAGKIFLGHGSDEAIDLLFRIFCQPGEDEVIICPPTYGMYKVSAEINDVAIREVPLTEAFDLDVPAILQATGQKTKLLFLCSPNNPTGNVMNNADMKSLLEKFTGIVVVDEAYGDFSSSESAISWLEEYPNLVVLQTFSKALGLAGLRVGMAFASPEIIALFNRIKPPYNLSGIAQEQIVKTLSETDWIQAGVDRIIESRTRLIEDLRQLPMVRQIYPTDANFVLVKVTAADQIYQALMQAGIIVRNRSKVLLCDDCLRITVGTETENEQLISALTKLNKQLG